MRTRAVHIRHRPIDVAAWVPRDETPNAPLEVGTLVATGRGMVAPALEDKGFDSMRGEPSRAQALGVGVIVAGKYRLERLIGKGAMGAVYVAQHEFLERRVALKFISEEHAGTSDCARRFLNEARAAAGIENEHVARILDAGQLDGGAPFMALEMLDGADLAQISEQAIEQGETLAVERVADWVLQALEGLAEAHSLGIIHRDLKPANLFLARRRDGSSIIKVLDFPRLSTVTAS